MPELNVFDGGLSTRKAPQFVQPNEATVLENCNIRAGNIQPFNSVSALASGVARSFYLFNGVYISGDEDRSYVEYNRRLYYSNGKQSKWTSDGETFLDLGVTTPDEEITVDLLYSNFPTVEGTGGGLEAGLRSYRIVEDNTYTYSQEINVINTDATITFTFSETKHYDVYALYEDKYLFIGSVDGPNTLIDGELIKETITEAGGARKASSYLRALQNIRYNSTTGLLEFVEFADRGNYSDNKTHPKITYDFDTGSWGTNDDYIYVTAKSSYLGNPPVVIPRYFTLNGIEYCYVIDAVPPNENYGSNWSHNIYKKDIGSWNTAPIASFPGFVNITNQSVGWGGDIIVDDTTNIAYRFSWQEGRFHSFNGTSLLGGGTIPKFAQFEAVDVICVSGVFYAIVFDFWGGTITNPRLITFTLNSPTFTVLYTNLSTRMDTYFTLDVNRGFTGAFLGTHAHTATEIRIKGADSTIIRYNTVTGAVTTVPKPTTMASNEYISSGIEVSGILYLLTRVSEFHSFNKTVWHTDRVYKYTLESASLSLGEEISDTNITGSYNYLLTYSDAGGANESPPSDSSISITANKQNIILSDIDLFANPDAKPFYRLYRVGGDLTKYTLVEEVPSTTITYIDTNRDVDISANGVLSTQGTNESPLTGKYLTEHLGRFWCAAHEADGYTRAYFSAIGNPQSWSLVDYIQLPYEITALGSTSNGLVVFTKDETWSILGTTADSFALRLVSGQHGCISHNSIQNLEGALIYLSSTGIMTCNGGSVQELSQSKVEFNPLSSLGSAVYDSKYYVLYEEGNMLIYDMRLNGAMYHRIIPNITGIGSFDNTLLFSDDISLLSEVGATEADRQIYKSGRLTEGVLSTFKEYDKIRVACIGTYTLTILIDDTTVFKKEIESTEVQKIVLPNNKNGGYSIQFELEGNFILNSIDYEVQGRSNG